jgi:cob(I)alamin adenosyltransferase
MSIVTRTGDDGTTGLMYGRRVAKHHPRVEAYGTMDELNAALGVARATATHEFITTALLQVQRDLVAIMGELATAAADQQRYVQDGYPGFKPEMTATLESLIGRIEAEQVSPNGWATPGATLPAGALDLARTVCRRAERRISALHEQGELPNKAVLIHLNRLADLLWLMARWVESRETPPA